MTCECLPEVSVYEMNVPLTATVSAICGGNYSPSVNASDLPSVNPSFMIARNEFGEDSIYFIGCNTVQADMNTSVGAASGQLTAWSESLRIKLFGPRKPPTK